MISLYSLPVYALSLTERATKSSNAISVLCAPPVVTNFEYRLRIVSIAFGDRLYTVKRERGWSIVVPPQSSSHDACHGSHFFSLNILCSNVVSKHMDIAFARAGSGYFPDQKAKCSYYQSVPLLYLFLIILNSSGASINPLLLASNWQKVWCQ